MLFAGALVALLGAGTVLLGLLVGGIALGARFLSPDDGLGPQVDDRRACGRTTVELDEVLDHFGLDVPADASDVRYHALVHPWFGSYSLELSFSLDRDSLDQLIDDSGLPPLSRESEEFEGLFVCPEIASVPRPMGTRKSGPTGDVHLVVLGEQQGMVDVAVVGFQD